MSNMDDVITLIKETVTRHYEYGNEVKTRKERELFCKVFSVTRNEFYRAAEVGLKPDLTVWLSDHIDYEGETLARYGGDYYTVIRAYRDRGSMQVNMSGRNVDVMGINSIELVLSKKIGNEERPPVSE